MKTRNFTIEELETHMNYDAVDKVWRVYTNIKSDYLKFKQKNWKVLSENFTEDGVFIDATFQARRKAVRIADANKREYTEEEKEVLRERMKKALETKNNN
jgi:hypothetical protein